MSAIAILLFLCPKTEYVTWKFLFILEAKLLGQAERLPETLTTSASALQHWAPQLLEGGGGPTSKDGT